MSSSSLYNTIRATVDGAESERVEVNQRALIDKILARYASAGAVYRELLQNSNDAEADSAEIYFTTTTTTSNSSSSTESGIVTQVVYRNNGMPFRTQDWSRLKKIAEGNPDVSKVGAFGVGAYTMFSICEEPLVLSGKEALAFVWKGDALYTKTAPNHQADKESSKWTSFILPSRDPYPLPDMVEFASFLCTSLTFTKCLRFVRVLVDDEEKLSIIKTLVTEPRPVSTPKSNSWWKTNAAVTSTSKGTFYLHQRTADSAILESVYRMTVMMMPDSSTATLDARFISATAHTKIPAEMARRMERVTKKAPPSTVTVQVFLNAQSQPPRPRTAAERVLQTFSPKPGQGRIFIGFRTSQTTGLAAHLAAPFVPTVEREAMDLQDPTLRTFNTELLEFSGLLMRLTLEDTMYNVIDVQWKANAMQRERLEQEYQQKSNSKQQQKSESVVSTAGTTEETATGDEEDATVASSSSMGSGLMGFARFMARGVTKKIVSVVSTVEDLILDDSAQYLKPIDPLPLFTEEEQAVVLMRSFCPQQSTPDPLVGTCIAQGFGNCLPDTSPPVLTQSGVVRGDQAKLPQHGIESFVKQHVVRSVVFKNAEEYHTVIAPCRRLNMDDLLHEIYSTILEEDRLVFLLKWWTKYSRVDPRRAGTDGITLKEAIRYYPASELNKPVEQRLVVALKELLFYVDKDSHLARNGLPIPESVIDLKLQEKIGESAFSDVALRGWFSQLPMEIWAEFISHHQCMTQGKLEDSRIRLHVLAALSREYNKRSTSERSIFGGFLASVLGDKRCVPFETNVVTQSVECVTERPCDLYLASAELKAFDGVGSFRKVSSALSGAGVTDDFLLDLGVRKSVSVDFLFASLDTLNWSSDPKPLVEYLRSATLTKADLQKLSRSQYLPAENDNSRT